MVRRRGETAIAKSLDHLLQAVAFFPGRPDGGVHELVEFVSSLGLTALRIANDELASSTLDDQFGEDGIAIGQGDRVAVNTQPAGQGSHTG